MSRPSSRLRALVALPLVLLASAARAQAPAPAAVDARVRREVVDTIAAHLERFYANADTGRLIAAHLRTRERAGAYNALADPVRFAEELARDLRAINDDKHLTVNYSPGAPAMRAPASGGLPTPGVPRFAPGDRPNGPAAPGGPGPRVVVAGPGPGGAALEQARRGNFSLGRVDILPGNVGYWEIKGFTGSPEALEVASAGLRYLENTDAMIFDLRRMPGGGAVMSNFLISHFTGPDTLASLTVYNRSADERITRYTLASVPGKRRPAVPVYILAGPGTVSAGEDFAFVMQNLGRAKLVGERTAGAGRNNAFLASGHGFVTSISFTRVQDPRTGREWEQVGVQPDVRVPERDALAHAHALALRSAAEAATDPQWKRMLGLTRETVEARRTPPALSAAQLGAWAGTYGQRTVTLEDGRLWFRLLPERAPDEMVPLGGSAFAVNNTVRLAFEQDTAGQPALRITTGDGQSQVYARRATP